MLIPSTIFGLWLLCLILCGFAILQGHEIKNLKDANTKIAHHEDYLKSRNRDRAKEIDNLREEVSNYAEEIDTLWSELASSAEEIDDLKRDLADSVNEINNLRREKQNMTQKLHTRTELLKCLCYDLNELHDSVEAELNCDGDKDSSDQSIPVKQDSCRSSITV
jgi:septal ring factor EnvC (AmiA/AmiB activator)